MYVNDKRATRSVFFGLMQVPNKFLAVTNGLNQHPISLHRYHNRHVTSSANQIDYATVPAHYCTTVLSHIIQNLYKLSI